MPFSPKIKLEVKKKADFSCCRCHKRGPQVHHIIPEKNGGRDVTDNAAPLCPTCHVDFGANPEKRKEIREMRDAWYEKVKIMYSTPKLYDPDLPEKVDTLLEHVQSGQEDLSDLKTTLLDVTSQMLDKMNPLNAASTATAIFDAGLPIKREPLEHFCHVYWDANHDMRCLVCKNLLKPSTMDATIFFCSICNEKHQLRSSNGTKVTEEEARNLLKENESQKVWEYWVKETEHKPT